MVLAALAVLAAALWHFGSGSTAASQLTSKTASANTGQPGGPPVPTIEPLELIPIEPDAAQKQNAAQPFFEGPITPAAPFAFSAADQQRPLARDCLAAGAWYEAGDDAVGQSSVVQVILNRVRHPAFPADICAVVFQGSERTTGCQFSFTCDGSMTRRKPSPAAWLRAQSIAESALSGRVDPRVGVATHYHTDWVVAYWSGEMEKLAKVGTHLFFRWPGAYGRAQAFARRNFSPEAAQPRMAEISPAHSLAISGQSISLLAGPLPDDAATTGPVTNYAARGANFSKDVAVGTRDLKGHRLLWSDPAGHKFVMLLSGSERANSFVLAALALCRGKPACEVLATKDAQAMPDRIAAANRSNLAFHYNRSTDAGETVQWDCKQAPRPDPAQCI